MNTNTALAAFALLTCIQGTACESDSPAEPVSHRSEGDARHKSPWVIAAEKHNVDPIDLCSIAFQESRRHRPDGYLRPWPWTLHTPTEGGMYFADCQSALNKLEELIEEGHTNIDVGAMQVNWGHHKKRVSAPAELLTRNIDVAAEIYRENLDATGGDIRRAIARYHNHRPARGLPYAAAVLTFREYLSTVGPSVCSRGQQFAGSAD